MDASLFLALATEGFSAEAGGATGGGFIGAAAPEVTGQTETQLEFGFVHNLSGPPPIRWPANGGFAGPPASATLIPGATVDRFGLAGGIYVSPTGTPYIQRSLAPGTQYHSI